MPPAFNPLWNPHYDFDAPANKAEIHAVENYCIDQDRADYTTGQVVDSPWGKNVSISACHENGRDLCIKNIMVKPGYMLSLQRHRGRDEFWEVLHGTLTVIVNGEQYDIPAGQSFTLTKGSVHSMINSTNDSLIVRETQTGICRERDNVRLVDFNSRPIYPITSEAELWSAKLYARLQAEHANRFGFGAMPHKSLME